jgi:hypothetical protein
MIIHYYLALLISAILASPVSQRQAASDNTTAPPKVTIGGPDEPVEITGVVNTAANLDQYFNIPFAKPRELPPTTSADNQLLVIYDSHHLNRPSADQRSTPQPTVHPAFNPPHPTPPYTAISPVHMVNQKIVSSSMSLCPRILFPSQQVYLSWYSYLEEDSLGGQPILPIQVFGWLPLRPW